MSYEKLGFASGQKLKAEHLNYMEEGIANCASPSWNDLADKPFYSEMVEGVAAFDGDLTGKEYYSMGDEMILVKMSDTLITEEELIGSTVIMKHLTEDGGLESIITEDYIIKQELDDVNYFLAAGLENFDAPVIYIIYGDLSSVGVPYPEGTYYLMTTEGLYVHSLSCLNGMQEYIIPIDEKYIPDSIARKDSPVAIIEVTELPTKNINKKVIYRLIDDELNSTMFIYNNEWVQIPSRIYNGDGECSLALNSSFNIASGEYSHAEGMPWRSGNMLHVVGKDGDNTYIVEDRYDKTIFKIAEGMYVRRTTEEFDKSARIISVDEYDEYSKKITLDRDIHLREDNYIYVAFGISSGYASHVEGQGCYASGEASHAEGDSTYASYRYSHAEGGGTVASGQASHAEGYLTTASGGYSHAEGYLTTASGVYSHAEGYYTTASGTRSHAEGYYTIASGLCQHVQGEYNIEDAENKYAHIVGNGSKENDRSNAHTLDWDGNAWYAGTVEGTAMIVKSPNGTRFQITVDDNGNLTATAVTE